METQTITIVIALAVMCFVAVAINAWLAYTMRKQHRNGLSHVKNKPFLLSDKLPTLTLAIPARNEDHALTDCLTAALASDYPKLEVIVMDDNSQDKTSQLILSFAHAGVRFVEGVELDSKWLGRNHALQRLSEHASGDYVAFMGVDTLLQPNTLTTLMSHMVTNKLDMASVWPQRYDNRHPSAWFNSLRYLWHAIVGPVTTGLLPASSQLWVIKSGALKKLGGLNSAKQEIIPESTIASMVSKNGGRYDFLVADETLRLKTEKKWSSLIDSEIRLLFPLHERNLGLILLSVIAGLIQLLPYGIFAASFFVAIDPLIIVPALLAILSATVAGWSFMYLNSRVIWPVGGILWPYYLLQETILLVISTVQYLNGTVDWKDRRVAYTKQRSIKQLELQRPS